MNRQTHGMGIWMGLGRVCERSERGLELRPRLRSGEASRNPNRKPYESSEQVYLPLKHCLLNFFRRIRYSGKTVAAHWEQHSAFGDRIWGPIASGIQGERTPPRSVAHPAFGETCCNAWQAAFGIRELHWAFGIQQSALISCLIGVTRKADFFWDGDSGPCP